MLEKRHTQPLRGGGSITAFLSKSSSLTDSKSRVDELQKESLLNSGAFEREGRDERKEELPLFLKRTSEALSHGPPLFRET